MVDWIGSDRITSTTKSIPPPTAEPTPQQKPQPSQAIHFVFVPLIAWSLEVWLAALGPLAATPAPVAAFAAAHLPPWLARCVCVCVRSMGAEENMHR